MEAKKKRKEKGERKERKKAGRKEERDSEKNVCAADLNISNRV